MQAYADAHIPKEVAATCGIGEAEFAEMVLTICEGARCDEGNRLFIASECDPSTGHRTVHASHEGIFLNDVEASALAALADRMARSAGKAGLEGELLARADVLTPASATLRASLLGSRPERLARLKAYCGGELPEIPAARTGDEQESPD